MHGKKSSRKAGEIRLCTMEIRLQKGTEVHCQMLQVLFSDRFDPDVVTHLQVTHWE